MATTQIFPSSTQDITADWLSPKIGVKNATLQLNDTIGGTATLVLLTATPEGDEAKPVRICIKGGFNPAMLAQFPFILSLYNREVDFYNKLAPQVPHLNVPRKLWAEKSDNNAILIMEDLSAANFAFASLVDTWSVDRVKKTVEHFAALHAATWGVEASSVPWLDNHYEVSVLSLCSMWDAIVLGGDRPPVPEYMKDQKRMTAAITKWFATRNPKFQCILHGDAHIGNMAWSEEQDTPMLVDWQVIHIGSCFTDVAYFTMTALTVEDRRAHEMEVLDHYLAKLHEFGGPKLSKDDPEVMAEYRKSLMAGYSWNLCPYSMQTKERVWAIVSRMVPAMEDHNPVELLEAE